MAIKDTVFKDVKCNVCGKLIKAGTEHFRRGKETRICSQECLDMRLFIIYDGRALSGDCEDATVIEVIGFFPSVQKAIDNAEKGHPDQEWALYSYLDTGEMLEDERFEESHSI